MRARRSTLPTMVLGSSDRNSTLAGTDLRISFVVVNTLDAAQPLT